MQPYLFPYIGYFQLIKAVDTFVVYDDVQYITRGWIHRNRILQNGEENLCTFSLQNDSSRKKINERYFTPEFSKQCKTFLKTLQFAYGRAPYFDRTKDLVERVFEQMKPQKINENIALKIGRSIAVISEFLDLKTNFVMSSKINKSDDKSGQDLILSINHALGSECYINPVSGKKLYSRDKFKREGIDLLFHQPEKVSYPQFSDAFVPWLSIIDVCMFNSKEEISDLLNSYKLIA